MSVADCIPEFSVLAAKKVKYFGLRSRTSIHHFGFEKSKKNGQLKANDVKYYKNDVILAKKVHFFNEVKRKMNIRKTFGGKILRGNRARKPDFGGPVGRRKNRFFWI